MKATFKETRMFIKGRQSRSPCDWFPCCDAVGTLTILANKSVWFEQKTLAVADRLDRLDTGHGEIGRR